MRVLVTGGGGLLGGEFRARLPSLGHTVLAPTHAQLDVTDPVAVARSVAAARPDVVLQCAAVARLERAEAEPEVAYRVNRDGARIVAEAAAAAGARIVQVSTDYVFDGAERAPYAPDHPRRPLNAYARSKAEGEDAVLAAAPGALVVRVSWLFGGERAGFVEHVLEQSGQGRPVQVVRDQWSRPTWTANVVDTVLELLDRGAPGGIWHVADGGEATRLQQAREVLRLAGVDAELIEVERETLWPDVPRPAYTVLDLQATEAFLGRSMEPWTRSLRRFLEGRPRGASASRHR